MSDPETRVSRFKTRRRNQIAKDLRNPKGPFKPRIEFEHYKREKPLRVHEVDIEVEIGDDEE